MLKPLIAALCIVPTLTFAQDYGTQPLHQDYTSVSFDNLMAGPIVSSVVVVPFEDGFVEFNCFEGQEDSCWTVYYAHFANALAWGTADPTAPIEDTIEALIPVETPTRSGGDVFPLRDGAVIEWEETWRSEEFDADYVMTLTVECCAAPISSGVSEADEHWVLTFNYVNSGEVGDPHEGTLTFYYDDALGVMVNQQSEAIWQDEQPMQRMSTLTGFSTQETE